MWIILGIAMPFAGLLAWWAVWISRRPGAPRWVRWMAWVPPAIWLTSAAGVVFGTIRSLGAVSGESIDPSQKARVLAQGIAETMNATALAMLVLGLLFAIDAIVLGVVHVRVTGRTPPEPPGSPPYR